MEARLRERAEEIARNRANLADANDGMREGELADYDQHPADTGTDTHDLELDAGTELMLAAQAEDVETAMKRLEEGTYGTCIDCGKEIPAERLEAIPEAIRCIEHQEQYEALHRIRSGPGHAGP